MKYQVQNIQYLSNDKLLSCLKEGANLYSKYADTELMFIYRNSSGDSYEFYEAYYGKRNFMHLAGIKSDTLSAENFYEACVTENIRPEDCTPKHSVSNMHAKVAILHQLLDLKNSKCYRIGEKDLVTRDNDFEMAIGNSYGVVGYDRRISKKSSKEIDIKCLPVPTTLLTNAITAYSSKPHKIVFILQKARTDTYYTNIFYEIKEGLLQSEVGNFPMELLGKIEKNKLAA